MRGAFRVAFLTALSAVESAFLGGGAGLSSRSREPCMKIDTGGAAIVCKDVDVWAGNSPLILDVNWDVMPKSRWALQGTNGCGKSTLLRAIAASAVGEKLEEGTILIDSTLRMGMLEQTAVSGSDTTVREEVVSRMARFQAAKTALDEAVEGCVLGSEDELQCLEKAQQEFEACGGYEIEARISKVLQGLGFQPSEFDSKCSSFSGGWQMRIGLARLLLSEPELLIMDEPTNHLDASARRWLGNCACAPAPNICSTCPPVRLHAALPLPPNGLTLSARVVVTDVGEYDGTVVVVSHDAEFVRRAADSIAEVAGGRLELYKSMTFDKYLVEREERQARIRSTVEAQERDRKRMQDFIDRMGAKASKAKQAKDREGKLEKLAIRQAAAKALLIGEQRKPMLSLATPPACGMAPLALRQADIRHPQGSQVRLGGSTAPIGPQFCARACACTGTHGHARTHGRARAHTHTRAHTHAHTRTHTRTGTHAHTRTHTGTPARTGTRTHTHARASARTGTHPRTPPCPAWRGLGHREAHSRPTPPWLVRTSSPGRIWRS